MTVSKRASGPSLGSDLKRVDGHVIQPAEYEDLPELTDEMFVRATVNRGGRPKAANPKRLISIRLTEDVIERWRSGADVRLLADGNDRPHHNIAGKAIGKTQTLEEVGMKRFPLGEQI